MYEQYVALWNAGDDRNLRKSWKSWNVLEGLGRSWKVLEGLGRSWKVLEGLGRSWRVETFEPEAPSLEVAGAPGAEIETILRFSVPTLCSVDVPI